MIKSSHYTKQRGMTLLELLVAVALLSIIAVMAFASINTLIDARQQMDETVERLNHENMVFTLFNNDLKMSIGRQKTTNQNQTPDFIGRPQSIQLKRFNPYQAVPRRGLLNQPDNYAATVIDVRWFVQNNYWYRATRPSASTAYGEWQERQMLPLQQMRCQYRAVAGQLLDRWPPNQNQLSVLPNTILCRLTTDKNGQTDTSITPWSQIW